jgi:hypothetical protein
MTLPLFDRLAADHRLFPDRKADLLAAAARILVGHIRDGGIIDRTILTGILTDRFGVSDATGYWSLRDAYDALELAQVMLLADPACALLDPVDPRASFDRLAAFEAQLPSQTFRSERQIDLQIFSTPPTLAWLAARAAHMSPRDMVLEPSAGTGMLAVHAVRAGSTLILNERDSQRARLLEVALGVAVARHDAEYIDDLLGRDARPSVVLINPPFARSETRGRDSHAGARHLRSALQRLTHGGRCVAIMPASFAADGSGATGYAAGASIVPPRLEISVDGGPFAKHGTGVSIRILLFDKGWIGEPARHVVTDVASALEPILAAPSRLEPDPSLSPAPAGVPALLGRTLAGGGLLRRIGTQSLACPGAAVTVDGRTMPLAYRPLETPLPATDPVGIYIPWRLSRMAIEGARPHPDQLVESVAMASIPPPVPTYVPTLPPQAIAALSDAQLESIIYAGQAFERDLPARYRPNVAGTLLDAHIDGRSYRMGYFLGDGTGVGKGQQVAGIILDQWCRGRRRAVWISKSAALIEDARRDWSALGGIGLDIQPLDGFALGQPITMESGILFLTYATLRSARHDGASRLRQLLDWLDEDFEGVVAFDEAHEMANAAGTETRFGTQKGSEQGLAGVRLQNQLPRARILYVSATGATDPANLCYAIRLGLWGQGTAFETREAFMAAIASGGIAAMEIVARDLKAMGLYTARALTFRGVEYEPLEHVLTPAQIAIYDAYADAWEIICAAAHKIDYREEAIMRRSAA